MLDRFWLSTQIDSVLESGKALEEHQSRDSKKRSILLQKAIDRIWKTSETVEGNQIAPLQVAVDELATLLNLERCVFLWYFPNTQRVQVVCERVRGEGKPLQGRYYPIEVFAQESTAIAQGEMLLSYSSVARPDALDAITRLLSRLPVSRLQIEKLLEVSSDRTRTGNLANLLVPVRKSKIGQLSTEDSWIGLIACLCEQPRHWSTADIEFVQLIAQQMEIAIRQTQLYEQTQKLLAREQLVNQIASQTRQSFDLETILTEAIAQLLEALAVDRCLVHMVEDMGDIVSQRQRVSEGLSETAYRVAHRHQHLYEVCREPWMPSIDYFDIQGPITQWAIQHRKAVIIPDITQDPRIGLTNEEYQKAQIKSSLVIPVQTKDKLHAILYLNQCSYIRYWSNSDRELAQAVANQLAISVQQACLFAKTRISMERESLLRLISDQIRSTLDLKTILQTAVQEVRILLNTDRVAIYQLGRSGKGEIGVEQVTDRWTSIQGQLGEEDGFIGNYTHLYQEGWVQVINDICKAELSDRNIAFLQKLQVKASLVVPILQHRPDLASSSPNYLWGLLIVHECGRTRVWQASEVELLQQLATQIAIAIQQAELYQQSQIAAATAQAKAVALECATAELQQANQCLKREIAEREQAEAALHQQHRIVRLLQAVAVAANEASTSEEALQICLQQICDYTGWPVGHVYFPNSGGELLPTQLWYFKNPKRFQTFQKVTEATPFAPGMGLPGRVAMSKKPAWVVDVQKDSNFPRAKFAADIGVRAGFAFPVLVGTEVVAVLEFFSTEAIQPNQPLLEIVANIGTQLGRVIERERASAALKASEAKAKEQAHQLEQTLYKLQQTQAQLIQTEKMSSLGQMVAGVAHEINNPVNFINGNLSFADRYAQDLLELVHLYEAHYPNPDPMIQERAAAIDLEFISEDLPKLLSSMKVGAERIRQIVLSLRTFSRLDQADMKRVNIHEGIDSTLLILQHRLKGKDGRPCIEAIKEYGDLPLVECYPGQLNQVFMNILSNAIDALEEVMGERVPTIRICTEMLQPDSVTVRIADNGLGMPDEVRTRLFDPFFTTKDVGKGTGLGLSISYQIVVEKHGGSIRCESAPGEGTEFWIEIPVQQKQQTAIAPSESVVSPKSHA